MGANDKECGGAFVGEEEGEDGLGVGGRAVIDGQGDDFGAGGDVEEDRGECVLEVGD